MKNFPWSPLCCFAKKRHFLHFYRNCYFSSNSSFFMGFFAQHKSTLVQLSIHSNQAIIELVFPFFFAFQSLPKKSAIFKKIYLGPLFAVLRKIAIFDTFTEIPFSLLITRFSWAFLHSTNLQQFSFPSILIRLLQGLYFLFFWPSKLCVKNRPLFKNFPWSPFCCFAKNRHFRHFYRNSFFTFNNSFFMGFLAQHKSTIVQLCIHTNQAIIGLVFPIFLAFQTLPKKSAIFEKIPFLSSLLFSEKSQFSTLLQKLLFLF